MSQEDSSRATQLLGLFMYPLVLAMGVNCVYVLLKAIYNLKFHPLKEIPGPLINRVSRLPMIYHRLIGRPHYYAHRLFQKYGPMVRLEPDNVGWIQPESWKDIYGPHPGGNIIKSIDNYRMSLDNPVTILNAEGDVHARMRKQVAPLFSERNIRTLEPMVQGYADLLMQRLRENCGNGDCKTLNLRDWYNYATFDIVGKIVFSSDFGCLKKSDYHPWVKFATSTNRENMILGDIGRHGFRPLLRLLSNSGLAKNARLHMDLTKEKLIDRLAVGPQQDVVECLTEGKGGTDVSLDSLHHNAAFFIIAGSETTATVLCGVTYLLLMNHNTLDRVVKEVRGAFKSPEEITLTSVAQLTYMLACLNEALRLYPPAPSWLPRQVAKGNAIIMGTVVPEKTLVSTWLWPAFHSEKNFTDPEGFHPERFLGDPKFAQDRIDALQAFSVGPRDCIGRNLAFAEMRLILAHVLFGFDLVLADDSSEWLKDQRVYILWEKPALNVYARPHAHGC